MTDSYREATAICVHCGVIQVDKKYLAFSQQAMNNFVLCDTCISKEIKEKQTTEKK